MPAGGLGMDRGVIMHGKDYLIGHMEDLADKAVNLICGSPLVI